MFQNKKKLIISSIIILIVLIGLGFYLYPILFPMPGIFTLNGTVRSVESNTLKIWANVPENSSFSSGVPNYVGREYLLRINPDSKLFKNEIKIDGNYFTELSSIAGLKINSFIDASVKENILKNRELNVVELTIIQ